MSDIDEPSILLASKVLLTSNVLSKRCELCKYAERDGRRVGARDTTGAGQDLSMILKGSKKLNLAPLRGANSFTNRSGGLHFVTTPGYFLATLRVA